ncbi:histidine kinase N-terminal 7TM domain-containing protein [Haladaptatus sp. CMSO5]|uniref:histidine kinase N-terminal 7TM domain-containing protein n=1 Tax=Haladaptatus sp. CMSO5 TaxID=3120514 RepID=UPI002FCE574C
MPWQYTPYTIPLLLIALFTAIIGGFSLRDRSEKAAFAFVLFLAAIVEWQLAYILQLASVTLSAKLLWNFAVYVGAVIVPGAWMVFALLYTGRQRFVTRRTTAALTVVPLLTLALLWTNESHHLVFASQSLDTNGSFVVLTQQMGAWHWFLLAYLYTQVLIAILAIIDHFSQGTDEFRGIVAVFLVASLTPLFANVAYFAHLVRINPTPLAFAVTVVVLSISMYRYQLFDIVPIAHDLVVQQITDPIVILDTDGRVAEMNDAAKDLFSIDAAFTGCHGSDILGDVYPHIAAYDGEDEQHSNTAFELGEYRYFTIRLMPIADDTQEPVGKIVIFREVTDRMRAEKRFELLIENVTDIITVIEADGTVRFQSQAFEHVLGYDPESVVGDTVFDLVHPDDLDHIVEEFVDGIEDFGRLTQTEARFRHADGSWRTLELHGKNLLNHPVIRGVVITSRDMTEREQHAQELKRQNDRLAEFANVVSHDLRNPLTVAKGRLEIAQETGDSEHFEAISRATTRMERIINDVLTLAKQGDAVGETQHLLVATVATEAWETVDTRDVTLTVETDQVIEADESRLIQLFENLFRNAIEHGGPDVTVRVGSLVDEQGFYVEDTGPGIPEADRARVFESGFTTNQSGTGFGLAIIEQIVEAHGWAIAVTAGSDGGARFEIYENVRTELGGTEHLY